VVAEKDAFITELKGLIESKRDADHLLPLLM